MDIKQQAFSGVKWTTLSTLVNTSIQLIQLVLLTQILNRQDFGLMAIVMVVIGFSQLFIDMGVSNAIIYKKEVTNKELSSLYWFNIAIGIFFFVLLFYSSNAIAKFYQADKLSSLLQVVAISFLIQPWGQQFMVFLQKELKFKSLAQVEIASRLVSFSTVIILAYLDYGVYALAISTPVYATCSTLGYNIMGRKHYRPKLFFSFKKVKSYLNFGLFQMGDKFLNYFALQMDTMLIGKILGIETLGLYNIAKDLTSKPYMIINPIITRVAFPLMSKINDDILKLKKVFLKTLKYLFYLNTFIYTLIIILAEPLVNVLFGPKWLDAISLIQILAITYILRSFGSLAGSLLLSFGKARHAFIWNLLVFTIYPVFIFMGSYWAITGVAVATTLLQIILFVPNWKLNIHRFVKIDFSEYLITFVKPLLFSALVCIPCYPLIVLTGNAIWGMFLTTIIFALFFFLLAMKFEKNLINDVFSFLPTKFKEMKVFVKLKNRIG